MAGVRGRRDRVAVVEIARGSASCGEGSRQGVVPAKLLGDIVSVMAYERRR